MHAMMEENTEMMRILIETGGADKEALLWLPDRYGSIVSVGALAYCISAESCVSRDVL